MKENTRSGETQDKIPPYWWNDTIEQNRRDFVRWRRVAMKLKRITGPDHPASIEAEQTYKLSQQNLRKVINAAKRDSWRIELEISPQKSEAVVLKGSKRREDLKLEILGTQTQLTRQI